MATEIRTPEQLILAINKAVPTFEILNVGTWLVGMRSRLNTLAIDAELPAFCKTLDADPGTGLTDYFTTSQTWTHPATLMKVNALLAHLDTDPALTLKPYAALVVATNAGLGAAWTALCMRLVAEPPTRSVYTDHDVTV